MNLINSFKTQENKQKDKNIKLVNATRFRKKKTKKKTYKNQKYMREMNVMWISSYLLITNHSSEVRLKFVLISWTFCSSMMNVLLLQLQMIFISD